MSFTRDAQMPMATDNPRARSLNVEHVTPTRTDTYVDTETGDAEDFHFFKENAASVRRRATEQEMALAVDDRVATDAPIPLFPVDDTGSDRTAAPVADPADAAAPATVDSNVAVPQAILESDPGLDVGGALEDDLQMGPLEAAGQPGVGLQDVDAPGQLLDPRFGVSEPAPTLERTEQFFFDDIPTFARNLPNNIISGILEGGAEAFGAANDALLPWYGSEVVPEIQRAMRAANVDIDFELAQAETAGGAIVRSFAQFGGAMAAFAAMIEAGVMAGVSAGILGAARASAFMYDAALGILADLALAEEGDAGITLRAINALQTNPSESGTALIVDALNTSQSMGELISKLALAGEGAILGGALFHILGAFGIKRGLSSDRTLQQQLADEMAERMRTSTANVSPERRAQQQEMLRILREAMEEGDDAARGGGDQLAPPPVRDPVDQTPGAAVGPAAIVDNFTAGKDFDALPGDPYVWVFHSTDQATAATFMESGLKAADKPQNLAMLGDAEFAPGRGVGQGLYVGGDLTAIPSSRVYLALRVRRSDLTASPEAVDLGFTEPGGALTSQGALITRDIEPGEFHQIVPEGRSPRGGLTELTEAGLVPAAADAMVFTSRLTPAERKFFEEIVGNEANHAELMEEVPSFALSADGIDVSVGDVEALGRFIEDTVVGAQSGDTIPPGFRNDATMKRIFRDSQDTVDPVPAVGGAAVGGGVAAELAAGGAEAPELDTEGLTEESAAGAPGTDVAINVGKFLKILRVMTTDPEAPVGASGTPSFEFEGRVPMTTQEANSFGALLDTVRETQGGRVTTRYADGPSNKAIRSIINDVMKLATEGAPGRFWYEESGRAILRYVGGDIALARKFVQLLAIYSANTAVSQNTQASLKAWNRWRRGEAIGGRGTVRIATQSKDDKAHNVLFLDGDFGEGLKTNNFWQNLMAVIDPNFVGGTTVDVWMYRAFGMFDSALATGISGGSEGVVKYRLIDTLTRHLSEQLNATLKEGDAIWTPHQVQAAVWTAIKVRWAMVEKEVKLAAQSKGWGEFDEKGNFQVKEQHGMDFATLWRDTALAADPPRAEMIDGGTRNFEAHLRENSTTISTEVVPGRGFPEGANHLPEYNSAPRAQQVAHFKAMMEAITDENGRDMIADFVGIMGSGDHADGTLPLAGFFEGESDIVVQTQVGTSRPKGEGGPGTDRPDLQLIELYSAMRGLLFLQDAVAWHRPMTSPSWPQSNMIEVNVDRVLAPSVMLRLSREITEGLKDAITAARQKELAAELAAELKARRKAELDVIPVEEKEKRKAVRALLAQAKQDNEDAVAALKGTVTTAEISVDNLALVSTVDGVRVLNYGDNDILSNIILSEAVEQAAAKVFAALQTNLIYARADSNVIGGGWKNGIPEAYAKKISDLGGPEAIRFIQSTLYPRVRAAERASADKFGWTFNEQLVANIRQALDAALDPRAEARRHAVLDARRQALDAEANRVAFADAERRRLEKTKSGQAILAERAAADPSGLHGSGAEGGLRYVPRGGAGTDDGLVRYDFDESLAPVWNAAGISTPTIVGLPVGPASAEEFHRALQAGAGSQGAVGKQVSVGVPADFEDARIFMTEDRTAGFAIKPDGNMVGLFNSTAGPHKGMASAFLQLAIEQGGKKYDAFDTALPRLYGPSGMRVVARIPWDDAEAPAGWDKKKMARFVSTFTGNAGEPDLIFGAYDPNYFGIPSASDGQRFDTFAEASAHQADMVAFINAPAAPGGGLARITGSAAVGALAVGGAAAAQAGERQPAPEQQIAMNAMRMFRDGIEVIGKGTDQTPTPTPSVIERNQFPSNETGKGFDILTTRDDVTLALADIGRGGLAARPDIFVADGGFLTAAQMAAARILVERQQQVLDGVIERVAITKQRGTLRTQDGQFETPEQREAANLLRLIEGHINENQPLVVQGQVRMATAEEGDEFFARVGVADTTKRIYINWDHIQPGEEGRGLRDVIAAMADMIGPERFDEATRGIIKNEVTAANAADLDMEAKVLARQVGDLFNAEEMVAARLLMVRSAARLEDLMLQILGPEGARDARTLLTYRRQMALHGQILLQVKGAQTEIARALQSFNMPVDPRSLLPDEIRRLVEGQIVPNEAVARRLLGSTGPIPTNVADPATAAGRQAIARINAARSRLVRTDGATKKMLDLLEEHGGKASAVRLAQMYSALEPGGARNRFIELGGALAKTRDAVFQIWISGLLYGLKTHIRNIVGNQMFQMWELGVIRAAASGIGSIRNLGSQLVGRGPVSDRILMGEVAAEMYGWWQAQPEAFALAWQAMVTGQQGNALGKIERVLDSNVFNQKAFSELSPQGKATYLMGQVMVGSSRALFGEDRYAQAVVGRMVLYGMAYRRYRANITDGMDRDDALLLMVDDLRNPPPDLIATMEEAQAYLTFTDRQHGKLSSLMKAIQNVPIIGRIAMPFRNVLQNITRNTFQNSPVGIFMPGTWRALLAGGADADIAIARIVMGSSVMGAIGNYYLLGGEGDDEYGDIGLTGGGPRNRAQRASLMEIGWRPWSIKIKKDAGLIDDAVLAALKAVGAVEESAKHVYISYVGLEPLGTLLAVSADTIDLMKWSDDTQANTDLVQYVVAAWAEQLSDRSFVAGLGNMMNAFTKGGGTLNNYLSGLARTFKPMSSLVNTLEDFYDDRKRNTRVDPDTGALVAPLYAVLNGWAAIHVAPVQHNLYGNEIHKGSGRWDDKVQPFYISAQHRDFVMEENIRLGGPLSLPDPEILGIKISAEAEERLKVIAGKEIDLPGPGGAMLGLREALSEAVGSFTNTDTDDDRRTELQRIYKDYVEAARYQYAGLRRLGTGWIVDVDEAEDRELALKLDRLLDPDNQPPAAQLPQGLIP